MCRPPMARAYNVIDADGHILEPLDLSHKIMCVTDCPHSDGCFPGAPQMLRERLGPLSPRRGTRCSSAAPLASTA
jgi:hypothetical protein